MGKIMKRKKKAGGGNKPAAKVDLISRKAGVVVKHHQLSPATESEHKRNIRRRNPSYGYDFDDDEEEEDEEKEEEERRRRRRREKKMKLVLKLPGGRYNNNNKNNNHHRHHNSSNNNNNKIKDEGFSGVDSVTSPTQSEDGEGGRRTRTRLKRLELMSESTSSEYGGSVKKTNNNKKRKIQGSVNDFYDYDDPNVDDNDDDRSDKLFHGSTDQKTKKQERAHNDIKGTGFVSGVSLSDMQELELILDKLQRKDTYHVFARPVDPDELPDYYDVIEHPMDFGTIRKKLAGGTYCNLEELENDVNLVCSNAMQYNAAETVYFKQAHSIQELARTKFQSFRIDSEHTKAEAKSEQKTKCNSLVKKPEKNSLCTPFQEPVGSDFSSGATFVSVVDTCALSIPAVQAGCEKPTSGDGLVNENSSLTENKPDEAEEQLSEKDVPTKLGKRHAVIDGNRRTTYNISSEPVVHTESIFTPFEGDTKQLVDVMLHEDHSYARSLARFAAALGPFAWKVASLRMEQALPTGMNFGRGWVGEYEPLPKPLLMPRSRTQKAQATLSPKITESRTRNSSVVAPSSKPLDPANNSPLSWPVSARKPPVVGSDRMKPVPLATNKQENKLTINFAKPENILRQIELNSSPSSSGTPHSASPRNPFARDSETKNRTLQMVSRNGIVDQSAAFKKPEVVGEVINSTNSDWVSPSRKLISKTEARSGIYSPRGNQNQGTNEPNQMMRLLAEKTQYQLTSSKPPMIDIQQLMMSAPSQRRDDSSAVATGDHHQSLNDANRMTRMLAEKTEHQLKCQSRPTTDTRELLMSVPCSRRNDSSATASDHHLCLSNPSQTPRMLTEKTQQQLKSSNPPTVGTQQLMMSVSYPRRDGSSAAAPDHHQGLSNPNQMPRMLTEKTQQQLRPSNPPTTGTQQFMMLGSSPRTDDSSAAATAAARAWMSLGAPHKPLEKSPRLEMSGASLFNPTQESSQSVLHFRGEPPSGGLQIQSLNRFHPQLLGREPHFQNSRQMVFPQRVTADLSQFQMQPPWQGFIQHTTQTNKKRDMLPPDLNLTFQSSGSSGILADSQLPDLALQL
ncbi:hypothetical protein MKX01_021683 [Papaver californicum]|nr:hypothetical protein MKX01_021683 [Papaver californicum]